MNLRNNSIAIIPARGGSKRIPLKNIKSFYGSPMISYSIEIAVKSNLFSEVIVSTDSKKIAEIANEYGAATPFIRPKKLSDDYTPVIDVIRHALNEIENQYRYVCIIYPTAPFIQLKYLKKGLNELKKSKDAINAFSATISPHPIQRMFKIDQNGRSLMPSPENYYTRSQDFDEFFYDAAQFYWTDLKREGENKEHILFSKYSIPIILPQYLVNDIDSIEDWERAEIIYKTIQNNYNY